MNHLNFNLTRVLLMRIARLLNIKGIMRSNYIRIGRYDMSIQKPLYPTSIEGSPAVSHYLTHIHR
jgi:hypothetical protein